MRFQDTVRFSLELVLPEKVVRALEKAKDIGLGGLSPAPQQTKTPSNHLRLLIEEMDRDRYGGLSFGTDTIALMTLALDRTIATYPQPVEPARVREIIKYIMAVAEDGERNPERLRLKAFAELQKKYSLNNDDKPS
ncbi:MAG: hypothetical protein V4458_00920 [Pseudomonadota bacterium]|nr:hypothetical protein [Afipia sp.]